MYLVNYSKTNHYHMQMPEGSLNITSPIWHLLKVVCGVESRFRISNGIMQILQIT
jgi:hypothetical protein